jgi:hypothetical protein
MSGVVQSPRPADNDSTRGQEPTDAGRRRSSMSRLGWFLSAVLVVTACSSPRAVSTPRSTSTTARSTATPGLRGIPVSRFECHPPPELPVAKPKRLATPQALLLCPPGLPGQSSRPVTITANQGSFAALISALSRPDEPKTGAVCPAYADLIQVVLARTGENAYRVSLPADGCGHYLHPAVDALNRARGTQP